MTLVRRLMLLGAAVGAVALVIAHIATSAERTHAQTVPATFYGTFDVGDVVVAFINDVSCATATTDADGNWIMQIPTDAPCSPADGDTVTFTRNGALLAAEETWRSGGAPADVANGVPGALAAGATPTLTPIPVQGQTETVIDETLDLTTDKKVVDGVEVLEATSADETITATIPIAAVPDTTSVALKIDTTAAEDLAAENAIPAGTLLANGEAVGIVIVDTQGDPITQFAADLTFTVKLDPATVDMDAVSVTLFDTTLDPPQWVQLDGDDVQVAPDGTVTFVTDHLTLFAILAAEGHFPAGGRSHLADVHRSQRHRGRVHRLGDRRRARDVALLRRAVADVADVPAHGAATGQHATEAESARRADRAHEVRAGRMHRD